MEGQDETQVAPPTQPPTSSSVSVTVLAPQRLDRAPGDRLPPLCVDLDGTLIKTDVLWETLIARLKSRPWQVFQVPIWLCSGKAWLKHKLAEGTPVDCASLPYTPEVLDELRRAKAEGRHLVLVSACDRSIAERIVQHVGLFDEVIASDGRTNVRGATKARVLTERFGAQGFDYVGNEQADVPVWQAARQRLVVNAAPHRVRRWAGQSGELRELAPGPHRLRAFLKALRCYQWSKNVLVFLPLLAAHAYFDWQAVQNVALVFFAWCFTASGIYVSNDLLDLEADRNHPTKKRRPFASGALPLPVGIVLAPCLLLLGLGLAATVSLKCAGALLLYGGCACAYSWHLKKRSLVDVFTLAFLFTIRVVGGGWASGYPLTIWLLAFSGFLFLGLAFLKRCSELVRIQAMGRRHLGSRGYGVVDLPVLEMFGVASAFTAIMVLALYISSAVAETHYRLPKALWAEAPFILLWLCRLWLATARGEMDDDPIVYSMKDWVSWALGGCVLVAFIVASIGLK